MLQNNVLLHTLNLAWNGFGTEGAFMLGDALKVNSTLEELDISWAWKLNFNHKKKLTCFLIQFSSDLKKLHQYT